MTVIVASDLDRTLIYSAAALARTGSGGETLVAVERYRDADASWCTARAARGLAALAEAVHFVPVTTRTPEQFARVRLPAHRYAICANGGVLLVDGVPDQAWAGAVRRAVGAVASLPEVVAQVRATAQPDWTVRTAGELFCYAVVDRDALPLGYVEQARTWARPRGWQVSLQGRKLYWVPRPLTKSGALAEVRRRTSAQRVLAAGDSLLDTDLLGAADEAIAARHGEMVQAGAVPDGARVTTQQGVLAGQEIVEWFASRVAEVPATR